MTAAVERLVNLALFLADARSAVTAEQIRTEVFGYPDGQDDTAFIRMFERDKDDLRAMGFAIEGDNEGAYRIDRAQTYASAIELTPQEAAAVRIAGAALLDDPSFPFAGDLRLALAKVSAEVADGVVAGARLVDENPQRQGEDVAVLSTAASAGKRVRFGYTNSAGVSAPHEVEPFGLFLHDGRWYLVGRDTAKDEVRTYAVARMDDVTPNAASPKTPDFTRPADFDVAAYVRLPFQYGSDDQQFEASILIDTSVAWRARSLAAGQGSLEMLEDGSVRWVVDARSTTRLARFVIENGPGLTILSPPAARDALSTGVREVVSLHA